MDIKLEIYRVRFGEVNVRTYPRILACGRCNLLLYLGVLELEATPILI